MRLRMFSADCTVLVTSCDAYRDVEGSFSVSTRRISDFWASMLLDVWRFNLFQVC